MLKNLKEWIRFHIYWPIKVKIARFKHRIAPSIDWTPNRECSCKDCKYLETLYMQDRYLQKPTAYICRRYDRIVATCNPAYFTCRKWRKKIYKVVKLR